MNKKLVATLAEMALMVAIAATAGIAWNHTLLTSAWRGGITEQAQAQPAPQQGEALPMPIALAQVKELHDSGGAVIVDARSLASFAEGHIASALSLPLEEARKGADARFKTKVAKDATVIAYCNGFSCHDSMELAKLLLRDGYASVYVYEGGFPEWKDAGYPVATGGI